MLIFGRSVCVAICLLGVTGVSATLTDRGGGLIYDNDFDVTWLADANYAKTQFDASGGTSGDADGRMNWANAKAWVASLSYFDSVRNQTLANWRLPSALNTDGTGPCHGTNCSQSELGHVFYTELSGTSGASILNSSDPDLSYFRNIQVTGPYSYWSNTPAADFLGQPHAWKFAMNIGFQNAESTTLGSNFAWAVTDGDVAAIPEPETVAMMLSGLGVVGWQLRRNSIRIRQHGQ